MDTTCPPRVPESPLLPPEGEALPLPAKAKLISKAARYALRLLRGLKSWLLASLSCLSVPFATLFSGWTYRLVQRRALTFWSKRLDQPSPFERILPRWFMSEDIRGALASARRNSPLSWIRAFFRATLGSFGTNLKTGFLVVLNSLLLTLPGGLIMMFSWYSGWDNSFNKGYEQAAIGPLWGLAGIALFIAAMTYVPIAQARQAITGSAKSFWNYRKVRDVIHQRPFACLLLIAGYTVLSAGIMISITSLMAIGNSDAFYDITAEQALAYLNSYYFWWAVLFVVPGFLLLKLIAGRIYAAASLDLVTEGYWKKDELAKVEHTLLHQAPVRTTPPAHPGIMRTSLLAFSFVGRLTLRTATFLLLLAFAFQLYIAQFFTFEPAANWLRQPLVQIPWYHNIPEHLKK